MSYATPPPPAKQRPGAVTAACYLLYLVAALYVVGFVVVLTQLGTLSGIYEEAFRGTEFESQAGISTASTVAGSALSLLFAVGLVVLAIFNAKGKNPARIVTWVVGGILLCLGGCGLLSTAVQQNMNLSAQNGDLGFDPERIEQLMAERLPGWYEPLTWGTSLLAMLALVVALILLALPAANEYFRAPRYEEPPPPAYPPVN